MSASRYAPGDHFDTCPATTGCTRLESEPCGTYTDAAHRCRRDRSQHARHACLCGHTWINLPADGLTDPEIRAILHPARHQA